MASCTPATTNKTLTNIRSPCPGGRWVLAPRARLQVAWIPLSAMTFQGLRKLCNPVILLCTLDATINTNRVYAGTQRDLIPFYSKHCPLQKDASLPVMQFRMCHFTFLSPFKQTCSLTGASSGRKKVHRSTVGSKHIGSAREPRHHQYTCMNKHV